MTEDDKVETLDNLQENLEKENNESLDVYVAGEDDVKPTQDDTPSGDSEDSDESKEDMAEDMGDGESHAYGNLPKIGQQGKKFEDKQGKKPHGAFGSSATPPERKGGKGGGGKDDDFMNAVWNELIIPFYTGCIDKAVDWTLDFTDWVLYMPFNGNTALDSPEIAHKKTVFHIADELAEQHVQRTDEKLELFKKAHEELKTNIEKYKKGESLTWSVWDQEPDFFLELARISTAAENPNSPEAKIWKRFEKAPEIVEAQLNKEKLVRKMAIYLGSLDLAFKKPSGDKFIETLDEKSEEYYKTIIENIEKIHEQNKGDHQKEREEVRTYLQGIKVAIEEGVQATQEYMDQSTSSKVMDQLREFRKKHSLSKQGANQDTEIIGANPSDTEEKPEPQDDKQKESVKTRASKAIETALNSVNNFAVNNRTLDKIDAPEKPYQEVLGGSKKEAQEGDSKKQVFNAFNRFVGREVRR